MALVKTKNIDDVIIRAKKIKKNKLLLRRQMVIDVIHPGKDCITKAKLQDALGEMFECKDSKQVVLYGTRHAYGGGRSTCMCLIYETIAAAKQFEPKFRLARVGLATVDHSTNRKSYKERRHKRKKLKGIKKYSIKM
mmetsp:Transcript_1908/g.2109  ORF Transcript_1908/g.2109 Transcript_1908/m.2109 type:complete len:137 (-) Transcript_1908:76-486(-)|eukprot:CAMPEP_0168530630 /NCGR_PEP_ID=MMETSP0405-20121227/14808_1 /TAXON_ID=498012 /ORGANISM="Trichosphaerium sp, Strain Am-I-7 wt" /LENGTH=136 /DNA_ID=CAMNT_0008554961 /DNA_START=42 /DNA_END=452 /DNA_ORIENTATION=-